MGKFKTGEEEVFDANDATNSIPAPTVDVVSPEVRFAFFAKKKVEKTYSEETITHTIKSGEWSADRVKNNIEKAENVEVTSVTSESGGAFPKPAEAKPGKTKVLVTKRKVTSQRVEFKRIVNAICGQETYLVVLTTGLNGKNIRINVKQGEAKFIKEKDKNLELMFNGASTENIDVEVGNSSEIDDSEKEKYKDHAIAKIFLKPESPRNGTKVKAWRKPYENTTYSTGDPRTTGLYLVVDAHSLNEGLEETNIKYYGTQKEPYKESEEDTAIGEEKKRAWLDHKDRYLVLHKGICPVDATLRSHFVIHCTADNATKSTIETKKRDAVPKPRSKAHIYVMSDGTTVEIWPFTEKNVWATKIESDQSLKKQMFHVELVYLSPTTPSESQYNTLADLYIKASEIEGCWPIIAPHIEVDRGVAGGHKDPTDFDYKKFYQKLQNKKVPIMSIPKFDHKRYHGFTGGEKNLGSDLTSWPPKLEGNPRKKTIKGKCSVCERLVLDVCGDQCRIID